METYRPILMLQHKCSWPSVHNFCNVPKALSMTVVEPWGPTDAYLIAGSPFWYFFNESNVKSRRLNVRRRGHEIPPPKYIFGGRFSRIFIFDKLCSVQVWHNINLFGIVLNCSGLNNLVEMKLNEREDKLHRMQGKGTARSSTSWSPSISGYS
jgi:hypothetical protein